MPSDAVKAEREQSGAGCVGVCQVGKGDGGISRGECSKGPNELLVLCRNVVSPGVLDMEKQVSPLSSMSRSRVCI